ncbi:hypothetical protein N8Z10_00125 [bacterium]|nr:hypothetical protein [bacterium]
MNILSNFGKREGLVYIIVALWVILGVLGVYKDTNFSDLSIYFGSLTAYAATYIWAESRRPSLKAKLLKKGPKSRREVMIYTVVALWAIIGVAAVWLGSNLSDIAMYFVSLSGFVASWLAGEVYTPQDKINKNNEE